MKFIADVMLGRLARYLRIAGYDVLYYNKISDEKLVEIAKREARILLTRDMLMLQRRDCKNNIVRSVFIKNDKLPMQLRQLKDELGIILQPELKRCVECN
ncbi:MAG: DUF5615 family PIN-like protein, partial [Actinobacteria bacterium]|nr:DUF5615 family PIN-like protein [Actinomycetota bacterium]